MKKAVYDMSNDKSEKHDIKLLRELLPNLKNKDIIYNIKELIEATCFFQGDVD